MAHSSTRTELTPAGQRSKPHLSCARMCQENLQKVQVYVQVRRTLHRDELHDFESVTTLALKSNKRNNAAQFLESRQ